jgi:hypothetical protein
MWRRWIPLVPLLALLAATAAAAGVGNPQISILGQPFARWTDDAVDPAHDRLALEPGEVEVVFDDYLNPYARACFTLSLAEDGMALEEGYFALERGLPLGLALKGGQYRVGFGKLNPMHPHQLPFAERPRVLAAYLPGEESFDEVGASLTGRIPMPGEFSLTAAADVLQGDSFRREREPSGAPDDPLEGPEGDRADEPRPGVTGRLSGFAGLGEQSGLEVGLSAAHGTNNVAAGTRTTVYGGDVKAKLWTSLRSYLVLQGELLGQDLEAAGWDEATDAYTSARVQPWGAYVYADYSCSPRWNAGALYERYQRPEADTPWDTACKVFAGFALMEETTAFRLDWDHYRPGRAAGAAADPPAVNTVTLRVIFSLGPHKAHQF